MTACLVCTEEIRQSGRGRPRIVCAACAPDYYKQIRRETVAAWRARGGYGKKAAAAKDEKR